MDKKKLTLTEKNILGKGTNKIVYYHPADKNKCIKFSLDKADETDIQYELKFRKICKKRVERSTLLTKYYGTVETNLGTGHVFELVRDFDGQLSETFLNLFLREKNSPKVFAALAMLKKKLFEELIITYKIFPDNFLVQRISEQEFRIRIIDGIGMHVFFPIPYYSKTIARRRQQEIWKEFMERLHNEYGLLKKS